MRKNISCYQDTDRYKSKVFTLIHTYQCMHVVTGLMVELSYIIISCLVNRKMTNGILAKFIYMSRQGPVNINCMTLINRTV